ncbi:FeoB-associated Cys-rich membrane protein [Brevibacillus fluminis]|uniref:FeoB-associated Cys-rich membrane protein n=1 Tax=Brevibacillus fluminis TaxID=511487 RepID=A0A3M8DG60_9BACL|nr:FeoB-associated Cys-rich membrane protein [Brevibacillus fluminis]RNB87110.1 FeoB-associated Cys-rich membrane protein [Brevibacillus fluminis]
MIYLVMAVVLGFATWQLIAFAKRARAGKCGGGGCSGCAAADGNMICTKK